MEKMFVNQNNDQSKKKEKEIRRVEIIEEENDRNRFVLYLYSQYGARGELEYNIGHNLSLSTLTDFLAIENIDLSFNETFWRIKSE